LRHTILESTFKSVLLIAKNAGNKVAEIYNGHIKDAEKLICKNKSDGSPITIADKLSHQIIFKSLSAITPTINIVSEENEQSLIHRKNIGSFWLIDPLDGTKEFIARNSEFTINIALILDGQTEWGVVYAPIKDLLYWGGRKYGSWLQTGNDIKKINVSLDLSGEKSYRVVASNSHMNEKTVQFIKTLGNYELIQAGSSLKLCKVAEGSADIYPRLGPTAEWDTAAGQAVLEGAGGYVYDMNGHFLTYGKPEVLNPYFIAAASPPGKKVPL